MTDPQTEAQVTEIRTLLADRLNLRGRDLAEQVRRAGRLLPRRVRRQARVLVEAERMLGHPKLSRRIDPAAVAAAHAETRAWLRAQDPADRAKGRLLGMLGPLSFNLLLLGAIVVAVLVWRGLV